jgi:hypothetical protein
MKVAYAFAIAAAVTMPMVDGVLTGSVTIDEMEDNTFHIRRNLQSSMEPKKLKVPKGESKKDTEKLVKSAKMDLPKIEGIASETASKASKDTVTYPKFSSPADSKSKKSIKLGSKMDKSASSTKAPKVYEPKSSSTKTPKMDSILSEKSTKAPKSDSGSTKAPKSDSSTKATKSESSTKAPKKDDY